MIACAVTDFPDPDSPRMASVSPSLRSNETPLIALAIPSRVRNSTCRSSTSSSMPSTGCQAEPASTSRVSITDSVIQPPQEGQRSFGSRASRTASPSMMNASTVSDRNRLGNSSMCGAVRISPMPDASEIA